MLKSEDIKVKIISTPNNKVSLSYMETPNTNYLYYDKASDFDMTKYTILPN